MPTLAKKIFVTFFPSITHPRCCAATWSTSPMTGNSFLGTPIRRWAAP
ncbi:uncharacterized protein CCOS01_06141, partial [Colletotrichum costaricense]